MYICEFGLLVYIHKYKFVAMPKDNSTPLDLKSLVITLNKRDNNIKRRRTQIDVIVDEDFALLADIYQKLAK